MQPIEALYALQELDQRAASLARELEDVPALVQSAALRQALTTDREERDRVANDVKRYELKIRQSEGEAAEARAEFRKLEEELYGGTVTSPKELRNIETKVATCKERVDQVEESALAQLEEAERLQGELAEVESRIGEREASAGRLQSEGEAAKEEIALRLVVAEAERDDARGEIGDQWLSLYDRLYKELRGAPVAAVRGEVCQGCRVSLPTSLASKVRSNTRVVRCDQCGRLLCSIS